MSQLQVTVTDTTVTLHKVRARQTPEDYLTFELSDFTDSAPSIRTNMQISKKSEMHKVYFEKQIGDKILLVFGAKKYIHVGYGYANVLYKKLVKVSSFCSRAKLTHYGLTLWIKGYVLDPYGVTYSDLALYLSEENIKPISLPESDEPMRRRKYIMMKPQKVHFTMDELLYDNATINCNVCTSVLVHGLRILYPVADGYIKKGVSRFNYIPRQSEYVKGWALHLRRSKNGNLVFVRRLAEEIESKAAFRLKENALVSWAMYHAGKLKKKLAKKPVNLFYEKFASKAEEGAYNLFEEAKKLGTSDNYFIIDKDSVDYPRIKDAGNVVAKYSWKYYWLLYTSDNFIATEAPIHINIVRSNNKYFRKSTFEKKFIFLQHGVTYLKCHDTNSPFVSGKEATPDLIVTGSEKEKDIVSDMLHLKEEQILVTGLPVFSNIEWEHMNQDSDDVVTVMLTWKPYEEFIQDFEETSYYKNTVAIFEMLQKYLPKEKIQIIPHPKIAHLMENTSFAPNIWKGEISKALENSKLLITDYSSVCYNSFYQGGGVVFFQPDLDYYEEVNGKLIPADDEYIGYRTYDLEGLEEVLKPGLRNEKVDLAHFRTPEFVNRYLTINSFTDGKNLERINESLQKLKII